MTAKQLLNSLQTPDGGYYVTLTDGNGNLVSAGGSSGITIGTTAITGGATTQVLFNLAGKVSSDSGLTYAGSGGVITNTGGIQNSTESLTVPSYLTGPNTGLTLLSNYYTSNAPLDNLIQHNELWATYGGRVATTDGLVATGFAGFTSRGTLASPAVSQNNDLIVQLFGGAARDSTHLYNAVELNGFVDGNPTSSLMYGRWEFTVFGSSAGSQTSYTPLIITSAPLVKISNPIASANPLIATLYAPNATTSSSVGPYVSLGVAASNYNSGSIQFIYAGSGNSANTLNFGLYGFNPGLGVFFNKTGISNGGTSTLYWAYLSAIGNANLQFGGQNASPAMAQTLSFMSPDSSGTNGANATIVGSLAYGNAGGTTSGDIIFQTGIKAASANATPTTALTLKGESQSVLVGNAAIATNATGGFLYIPTCAGTPTGTPTAVTGLIPMVYDTSNHQFWFYDGGWKQPKTPAGAALVTWQ